MKLIVNGSRVWDPLIKGAEIALALRNDGKVLIDLNGESPSLDHTALPEYFSYLESQGLDTANITVLTGNPLESYRHATIQHNSDAFYEIKIFQDNASSIPTHKNIKYHFGNFVSRTTLPRLVLSSHLYTNYREKTFQTFHYDHSNDYHKTHLEMDALIHQYGPNSVEFNEAVCLLKASPLLQETVKSYPILHISDQLPNIMNPCQWYPDIFVDVICETWYQGQIFYITEKFWRAVSTKTPFIIHGAQNILTNLKKLGFKTFDEFWDEGYQEDPSFYNITGIKQVLQNIASQPLDEIRWMYKNMQEIVDHNYQVFMNISRHDIIKVRE